MPLSQEEIEAIAETMHVQQYKKGTILLREGQIIAVLPFVNMSSDPEQDYFSDGITEEILNALAQIRNLKVAAAHLHFNSKAKPGSAEGWRQIKSKDAP